VLPVITMEGTVVADPELRFAPTGTAVGNFRLVANGRKRTESGEWVDDKTLWMSVTCFRQLAENVAESLRKGDLAVATGTLQTEEWENQEGKKQSRTVMIANSVSASLMFRTIPHGEARRAERSSSPPSDDAWTAPSSQAEEPPF
jgi:single-strand DNA-binding protein